MKIVNLLCVACFAAIPASALAEVSFPQTRSTVGPDEIYILEDFGAWQTECIRDKKSEDFCYSSGTITALEHGLELYFSASSYIFTNNPKADVNVAPVAAIRISPYSSAKHYDDYSAAITSVDGIPFDGYWCPLTDDASCFRGPELAQDALEMLLAGNQAVVTIYDKASTPERYTVIAEINVELDGFVASYNRAREFSAEILGIELLSAVNPLEMCDLYVNGRQKRISYSYDEDFEQENTSLRESFRGPKGGGSCPSYVSLAYLTPDMTPAQRKMFCLVYDSEKETFADLQQGQQNAYRVCKEPTRSVCERVNSTKEGAIALTSFASAAVGTAVGTTTVTGTTVVMHSSGAAILTGSAGYVSGTLGTIGTTALGFLTLPATLTAAAVSVVAVGGAVYVCSE